MKTLTIERRTQDDGTGRVGSVLITPSLGGDYWSYRVRLTETQAIVGFPKFNVIGVGFANEDDWNTNLPSTCGTREIFEHIQHNKGDDSISDDDVLLAIAMVCAAADLDGEVTS